MRTLTALIALIALTALPLACSIADDERADGADGAGCADGAAAVRALRATFAQHAPAVLAEGSAPFVVDGDALVAAAIPRVAVDADADADADADDGDAALAAVLDDAKRAMHARLPLDAARAVRLSLADDDFTLDVRESGVTGAAAAAAGHVSYARTPGSPGERAGRVFWRVDERGAAEEWLHVPSPRAGVQGEWHVSGARLRALESRGDALVAIIDSAGRDRVHVTAPAAFGSSGRALTVRLVVDTARSTISAVVDDVAGETELLIDPVWAAVSSMATPRRWHTATLLPDGRVLFAGGYAAGGATASVEIFDPRAGTWSPAAPMQNARYDHAAVLLPNGGVFVSGGKNANGAAIAAGEIYYVASNNWVGVQWMATARAGHTLTLLSASGLVLAVGGGSATCELFDGQTWSPTNGPASVSRANHTATRIAGGKVLVVGGTNTVNSAFLASAEIYSEATGTFTPTTPLPGARASHTATLLRNGQVLVAGGRSSTASTGYEVHAWRYVPATQQWNATGSLLMGRAFHTATLLPNDRVLVVGGVGDGTTMLTIHETYAATSGTWTWASSPAARYQHTATLLHEGRVVVAGGTHLQNGLSGAAWIENPAFNNDGWRPAGSLGQNFEGTATLLADGRVLLKGAWWPIGGFPVNAAPAVWIFDPVTSSLQLPAQPPSPVYTHAISLRDDGTVTFIDYQAGNLVYDPAANAWSSLPPLIHPRGGATANWMPNGKLVVVGGSGPDCVSDPLCLASWMPPAEIFDPATSTWSTPGNVMGRMGHTTTVMANGKLLITGGASTTNPISLEIGPPEPWAGMMDPDNGVVQFWAQMQNARCFHTTTSLPDGRVVVLGGSNVTCYQSIGAGVAAIEVLDSDGIPFVTTGNMIRPRMRHTATVLNNGEVMVTGGLDNIDPFIPLTEVFDPATGQMSATTGQHKSIDRPVLLLADNRVLQFGWYYPDNLISGLYTPHELWIYDEGRLQTTEPLLTSLPATAAPGGTVNVNGLLMQPDVEATEGSATNTPRFLLQRIESETRAMGRMTSIAGASASFFIPADTLEGWYQARLVVNGIPSKAKILRIE